MEENEVLIKVEGLSKKFCKDLKTSLWYGIKDLTSNVLGNSNERELRPKEFWAVKDINFELRRGECLGLIGHNGAGKSTLLKILNGLIKPDEGKVTIKGRVSALIELGAGFNPILSGRENIYNNGAVLGFTKAEIDAKIEEIIDFSEIREFIDMPVQNYSSGMKVRLGFAVAGQMEPDILIIDEVLAVGDISFRIKCYNTIATLLPKTAIIFVSHSMPQISKICTKVILLNKGIIKNNSRNISDVINEYFLNSSIEPNVKIIGNGKAEIIDKSFYVKNKKVEETQITICKNEIFKAVFSLKINPSIKQFTIRIIIYDTEFKGLIEINSMRNEMLFENNNEIHTINFEFKNPLNHGNYSLTVVVLEYNKKSKKEGERIIRFEGFGNFKSIDNNNLFDSYIPFSLDAKWDFKSSKN